VKDEIFKKKACGDKLHASTLIVEELQAKLTTLEGECNQDPAQTCAGVVVPFEDALASKESEISTLQQNLARDKQEINSLKQLLHKTELAHADTTAVWKHCKSDVKDEIFKKKACGDKLHASTLIVEELQAKLTALEAEFKRNCSSPEESVAVQKKRRNPFKYLFNFRRKRPAKD
jgi:chromosome segregation ATPase